MWCENGHILFLFSKFEQIVLLSIIFNHVYDSVKSQSSASPPLKMSLKKNVLTLKWSCVASFGSVPPLSFFVCFCCAARVSFCLKTSRRHAPRLWKTRWIHVGFSLRRGWSWTRVSLMSWCWGMCAGTILHGETCSCTWADMKHDWRYFSVFLSCKLLCFNLVC